MPVGTILSLVSGLVKLANMIVGWLDRRSLIETGKALAIGENLNAAMGNIEKARLVRDAVERDSPWADRVRDKYTRRDK